MKTPMLRVWASGAAIGSLLFCTGCREESARAEVPVFASLKPAYVNPPASALATTAARHGDLPAAPRGGGGNEPPTTGGRCPGGRP